MYDRTSTIEQFLDATAAKQPAPGGGSVTALTGALAAAIGEMVLNYSIGKKGLEAYQDELRPAVEELHRARLLMLELMVEDQAAYAALTALRKLPHDAPQRLAEYPVALLASIRAPQAIGATAVAILGVCDRITNFVNYYLLSDLAVSADLAMATVRCAVYNVRVNLTSLTEESDRRAVEQSIGQLLANAAELIQRVSPRIWSRHGQGA
jgi:formiminotetrahydrofolate cyclodeaminase